MKDQSQTFGPMTCEDTASAISSQASESGATPCASPDGPTSAKRGAEVAPVSPSARPAKAKRSTTKGIYGQSSFLSSKSEDLSSALASKYQALTDSLGSTLFTLTWSTRITPLGFSIPALRASEPRTEDSVCIGWPTPQASETKGGGQAKRSPGRANLNDFVMLAGWPTASGTDGERAGEMTTAMSGTSLTQVAKMASWVSPKARDFRCETAASTTQERMAEHQPDLNKQVMLAGWKTPCVPNGGRISGNLSDIGKHQDGTKAQIGLENEAKLSGWTTPQAHDQTGRSMHQKEIHGTMHGCACLVSEARLTAFGDQPIGYLLGPNGWEIVPACGQLNAAHSRWLMGLPPEWDVCGATAMASLRGKRRRS